MLQQAANWVPFLGSDLQVLASEYLGGVSLGWDPYGVFDVLLGPGPAPQMFVLQSNLSRLLAELIVVVNPGMEDAAILRLNMAPEYLWLGVHSASASSPRMCFPCFQKNQN